MAKEKLIFIVGVIALLLLAGCKPVPPPGPDGIPPIRWGGPGNNGLFSSNGSNQGSPFSIGGDDWAYNPVAEHETGGYRGVMPSIMPQAAAPKMMAESAIGFSVGGAKDIGNFRQNINDSFLPIPTDIAYEGLFYDYYFDTGESKPCDKLFCPSYTQAISKDPVSGKVDNYLAVGLNSGVQDFKRKKQNIVIVLDISGSMSSPFDQYYYDKFGKMVPIPEEEKESQARSKVELAERSIVNMIDHLKVDDRLGIVLFDQQAYLAKPLSLIGDTDLGKLKDHILSVRPRGSTNMEAGLTMGASLFDKIKGYYDPKDYDNRIVFLTDAQPNTGDTTESGFLGISKRNAKDKVYTTFIGIGVDFNTQLIESISKVRGANYYSVHSEKEFKKRLDDEFDFMVTPMVFDLRLRLDAPGYEIEKVYGSPQADEASGEIMYVDTLFPSAKEEGKTRGGVILLKLKEREGAKPVTGQTVKLIVDYMDRDGKSESVTEDVKIYQGDVDRFDNTGIRKAVLLSRYADLLKAWVTDERRALAQTSTPQIPAIPYEHIPPLPPGTKAGEFDWKDTEKASQPKEVAQGMVIVPCITRMTGIFARCFFELGQWERQSAPLRVMDSYKPLFKDFAEYFGKEIRAIGDDTLQKEFDILHKLESFQN